MVVDSVSFSVKPARDLGITKNNMRTDKDATKYKTMKLKIEIQLLVKNIFD